MISAYSEKLKKLKYHCSPVEGFDIIYNDAQSVKEELAYALGRHGEFYLPLVLQTKQRHFQFEDEYRLYVISVGENNYPKADESNQIRIPLTPFTPSELITEVLVHPNAEDQLVEDVRELCKKNAINFSGKSQCFLHEILGTPEYFV